MMENAIQEFIRYLHETKDTSSNTEVSYTRDLKKLVHFLGSQGIEDWRDVTATSLNSYMLFMEREAFASSSISRSVASIRAFFHYLEQTGKRQDNPAEDLKSPKIVRRIPEVLAVEEVDLLLTQPSKDTLKGLRDRAMMELLYATGIRVSELIHLKKADVNMKMCYICCREKDRERIIPFGNVAKKALVQYLDKAKEMGQMGSDGEMLFTNCSGNPMSRQGFWKVLKGYAKTAGISGDITPHTLRHSFAAHLIQNGADLKSVQEMMGHSDISTTQMYLNVNVHKMRDVYEKAHPRG